MEKLTRFFTLRGPEAMLEVETVRLDVSGSVGELAMEEHAEPAEEDWEEKTEETEERMLDATE